MDATPFVSVIIPTYHDWDRLKLCLKALEQQRYPTDRFEVLVVNNDPEGQWFEWPNIHHLQQCFLGHGSKRHSRYAN